MSLRVTIPFDVTFHTVAFVLLAAAAAAQTTPRLRDLNVPAERLPAGCVLSPTPTVRLDGNKVRGGLWANLPANPWIGTDPVMIASIRERFDPLRLLPDGPPLNARESALFR